MSSILVTGGAGYIGSHLAQYLLTQGQKPILLDDLSSGASKTAEKHIFYLGSINDISLLKRIFRLYNISSIIHLAAFSNVKQSIANPQKCYENNIQGTKNLIKAAKTASSLKSFIFASSCLVYKYNKKIKYNEEAYLYPSTPYGESKLRGEEMIRQAFKNSKVSTVILRLFNVCGLGEEAGFKINDFPSQKYKVFPQLVSSSYYRSKRTEFKVFGSRHLTYDGYLVRDYVHINDVVPIIYSLLVKSCFKKMNLILNIGSGRGHSVKELITATQNFLNCQIDYKVYSSRIFEHPEIVSDNSKFNSLGYKIKSSKIKDILTSIFD